MDLRQLRYFVRIVEVKSFTKAAELLGIAQPSLGLQIRKLEDELETELLERHSRGIAPTEAGLALFHEAQALLEHAARIKQTIMDSKGPPSGKVALGMTPTVNAKLSTSLVTACRKQMPSVTLSIAEDLSTVLLEWIMDGRLDLALVYRPAKSHGVLFEPLMQENLYFIGKTGTPDVVGSDIAFTEVAEHPLVIPNRDHGLRMSLESAADREHLKLNVLTEVQSVPSVRSLVREGHGYTVLPYGAVKRDVESGELSARKIVAPEITPVLCLAYSQRHALNKAEVAVRELISAIFKTELANEEFRWYRPDQSA